MRPYTLVQLFEVVIFAGILLYGLVTPHLWVAVVGGWLLIGKAVLNILAVEGGTVARRSLLAYAVASVFLVVGIVMVAGISR